MEENKCCYIDPDTATACEAKATWVITYPNDPKGYDTYSSYTHACEEHKAWLMDCDGGGVLTPI